MKNQTRFFKKEKPLFRFLRNRIKETFREQAAVAVKLHMGEPGNRHYIKAAFAQEITNLLVASGLKPVLFDTPVVYSSPRNSVAGYMEAAATHGYSEKLLGVPVIISDESRNLTGSLGRYQAASIPLDADGVILLTHFKGHICSGAGGAIKNVGMGCMSKSTKGDIHGGGEPVYTSGCTGCGNCAENCPTENIRIDDSRPWFDATWCSGCSNCIISCPQSCLSPVKDLFDNLLSDAAVTAHREYKKVLAINIMREITQLCDCMADAGPVVTGDIGYVCADDMLSADIASMRILAEHTGEEDIFQRYNKVSSWGHIKAAAKFMNRDLEISIEKED
ncbi:MAG: DUF362 domain-containing protein [Candidatus Krumholzibacteriota bacterium]|nr:DUF362 domain-containing protein [Candidatus Krumholzibacteriota bacterium]